MNDSGRIPAAPEWADDSADTAMGLTAHPARVYNYLLGGKDNFQVDRDAGDGMIAFVPDAPRMALANRRFVITVVHYLVDKCGIGQFLDVGSGIPMDSANIHEIAQVLDPAARVVYVDRDLVVAAHSRAKLISSPEGRCAFICADARKPRTILDDPILAETLDLGRPVALMLASFLMYFPDEVAHHIVRTLVDALPRGSYLAISHPTADFNTVAAERAVAAAGVSGLTYIPRTRTQVARFFAGMELVEPGIVPLLRWHPELHEEGRSSRSVYYWTGVGMRT